MLLGAGEGTTRLQYSPSRAMVQARSVASIWASCSLSTAPTNFVGRLMAGSSGSTRVRVSSPATALPGRASVRAWVIQKPIIPCVWATRVSSG